MAMRPEMTKKRPESRRIFARTFHLSKLVGFAGNGKVSLVAYSALEFHPIRNQWSNRWLQWMKVKFRRRAGTPAPLTNPGLSQWCVPARSRSTEVRPQIESGSNKSSILPRLSANESRRTPTLSSRVRWRLASGVGVA